MHSAATIQCIYASRDPLPLEGLACETNLKATGISCKNVNSHVKMLVYQQIVLAWQNGFPAETIYGTHMSNSEHYQFFVLIYVTLFTEIISSVRYWVSLPLSIGLPLSMTL